MCLHGPTRSQGTPENDSGFSLIELLIVVAIILIIAAISVPNLLRSRIAANEASAVALMRTINTSEVMYATTYSLIGYSADLASLGGTCTTATPPTSGAACLMDPSFALATGATNPKSGYYFTYVQALATVGYTINANPTTKGLSGIRTFYTNSIGVIHANATGAAAAVATDPAI